MLVPKQKDKITRFSWKNMRKSIFGLKKYEEIKYRFSNIFSWKTCFFFSPPWYEHFLWKSMFEPKHLDFDPKKWNFIEIIDQCISTFFRFQTFDLFLKRLYCEKPYKSIQNSSVFEIQNQFWTKHFGFSILEFEKWK